MPFYSIILPAYNEQATIERAIVETATFFDSLAQPYELLVVDDGSQDRTRQIVARVEKMITAVRLIRHTKNKGKGAAVRTGMREAKGEWMLFLDCDLSTHPSEFKKCVPFLSSYEIIIGSRRVKGARIIDPQPWHRTFLGRCFNFFIRHYLDLPYHDTQCGFKVFHQTTKPLFDQMTTAGWTFDVEFLCRARRAGCKIKEIPVIWHNGRETRVRLKDAWKIWREIQKIKQIG